MESSQYNIWQILAGIGLFLFGMQLMEMSIKHLAGRSFKLFLKKQTTQPLKAIIAGLLVTAILQSSSIVNLLVLAFVGARILTMRNAMAIILGSNLGSTVYNWIVVFLGFKFDIQSFAFPILALGAAGIIFFQNQKRVMHWTRLGFGIALLFVGLANIKIGVESVVNSVDLKVFETYGNWIFVIVGFVITTLVQSSATTVVITLSALNAGALTFEPAACLVIGSEVGTSMKTVIGSIGTQADKKRVALGNFIQNIVSSGVAFVLLWPLTFLITKTIGIADPLIALVTFQSTINIIGILIFYPLLPYFSNWLDKQFKSESNKTSIYISELLLNEPEEAIKSVEKEGKRLLWFIVLLNRQALEISENAKEPATYNSIEQGQIKSRGYSEHYEVIKHYNGELLDFCLELQNREIDTSSQNRILELIKMLRNATGSSKSVKDIRHNIKDFRDTAEDSLHEIYKQIQKSERSFYDQLSEFLFSDSVDAADSLKNLQMQSKTNHDLLIKEVYRLSITKKLHDLELATLINVLGELQNSHHALIQAVSGLSNFEKTA